MVRISDLVRGKAGAPGADRDMHALRLKNVSEIAQFKNRTQDEDGGKADQETARPRQGSPSAEKPLVQEPSEALHESAEAPHRQAMPEASSLSPESPRQADGEAALKGRPNLDIPVPLSAKEIYGEARRYLLAVKESLPRLGKLAEFDRSVGIVERIIAEPALIKEMYPLTMFFGDDADLNTTSSVNCMTLCLKIGARMGYPPPKLTTLALAALHHDIGMFMISQVILNKTSRLSAEEIAEVRTHTRIARDLLLPFEGAYPEITKAVYQHHERESGQGYPEGLQGADICEYAKIIGICDTYEAMTHNRPHKRSIDQHVSVQELVETKAIYFSPRILKVFLDEFTLYPVGSYVRLNNRSIGVVVATNPNNSFKPLIQIVVDGQGHKVTDKVLCDLAENNILNIVAGASADELSA